MAIDSTIALTDVAGVLSYFGEAPATNAFWIYYTDSASTATVQVLNDYLILIHDAAEDANLNLNADAYDTIGELVSYINSDVSGWTAGHICHSSEDSDDLLETGQLNALGESNKETLKIVPEYFIAELINRASDFLSRYCNRKFVSQTYTNEIYDGHGFNTLILEQYPVTQIISVGTGRANAFSVKNTTATTSAFLEITPTLIRLTVDGTETDLTRADSTTISDIITAIEDETGWDCTLSNSDFGSYKQAELLVRPAMHCLSPSQAYAEIVNDYLTDFHLETGTGEDRNFGTLYYPGIFTTGHQNVFISYVAGYSTIPYSLESICIELVKIKFEKTKINPMLKSETIGSVYKYTLQDVKGLSLDMQEELSLFKKWVI